ncbi:MAG: Ig-like domain-containing protein [Clostridia bacterium]
MKKFLSVFLCAAFLASSVCSGFAFAANGGQVSITSFKANTCDVVLGEHTSVTFYADITSVNKKLDSCAMLYDDNGKVVAKLFDNGQNGDEKSGDGIYSATVSLYSDTRGSEKYHTEINGVKSREYEVNFYHLLTNDELSFHDSLWNEIDGLETSLNEKGVSSESILNSVYSLVKNNKYVERIDWQTDYSFSFTFIFGNTSIYARWDLAPKGERNFDADAMLENIKTNSEKNEENASWEDPDFAVFRPYRRSPDMGDFNNEFYTTIANNVMAITGGTTTDFQEEEAYPGNLINLDQYGFYIVDSHGTTAYAGGREQSYMMMREGNRADYEFSADISAGHIITGGGGDVGVTGSFFTKYFQRDNKEFDNMLMYLVVCYGMATDTISQPVLDLGGILVAGYTESVSFTYDFMISEKVWQHMVEPYPDDSTRNYTFAEAVTLAKQETAPEDPWGNPPSVLIFAGAGDYTLSSTPIPLTNITLDPPTANLYINNNLSLSYIATPDDANLFTLSWASDNESVATVDANGKVTAIADGEANITCTALEVIEGAEVTHVGTCKVSVLGIMPVSGIELDDEQLQLYTGTQPTKLDVDVIPENASNQKILYQSNNADILTIDENGMMTGLSSGIAVVTATTEDGNFSARCVCYVTTADANAAFNAEGGALSIENSTTYPWIVDLTSDTDRVSLKSDNHNTPNSKGTINLDCGTLPVGTVLKFDWKTNCEERYDKLKFLVNSTSNETAQINGATEWATYTYTVVAEREFVFSWMYAKDSSRDVGEDCAWIDNVEVIVPGAVYTVNFFDMNDVLLKTEEVVHGEEAEAPANPTHQGYDFLGWDKSFSEIRSDLNVTAVFIENGEPIETYYTVTFVDYNGTVLSTQEVIEGGSAIAPTQPVRDGYVFTHWDKEFAVINENTTITAVYAILGDANLDGITNTGDAAMILRLLVGVSTIEYSDVADYNKDGEVNTGDAAAILAFLI